MLCCGVKVLGDLYILVYKNYLLKIRKPFKTLMQMMFPAELVLIIWFLTLSGIFDPTKRLTKPVTHPIPHDPSPDFGISFSQHQNYSNNYNGIINRVIDNFRGEVPNEVDKIGSKDYYNQREDYMINVEFRLYQSLPEVTFRNYSSRTYTATSLSKYDRSMSFTTTNQFAKHRNLLGIQNVLGTSIWQTYNPHSNLKLHASVQQFPIKGGVDEWGSMMYLLMFVYYFAYTAVVITTPYLVDLLSEKENKLKTYLINTGTSMTAYHLSWVTIAIMSCFLATVLTTAMVGITGIINRNVLLIFFLAFFLYTTSFVPVQNIFSEFLNDPKKSAVITQVFFFCLIAVWAGLKGLVEFFHIPVPSFLYLFVGIVSPYAFGEIMYVLIVASVSGLEFSVWEILSPQSTVTTCLFMLFVDFLLYCLLAIYVSKIRNESKSILFPCSPLTYIRCFTCFFFSGSSSDSIQWGDVSGLRSHGLEKHYRSSGKCLGLFGEKIRAVDGVSLDIQPGQIFCLLGENGAGKSTTIRCMTGEEKPSKGKVTIGGMSIYKHLNEIRRKTGICPQKNLLFPLLTVLEHVRIVGVLKGDTQNIHEKLMMLGLQDKMHQKVEDLSGGEKRRLCFLLSLLGQPKLLVLDECTAGLDVLSKRKVWTILQDCKGMGAMILLTTHSMEEAELLGDRVGILKEGKLLVIGDILELKQHFGVGYRLTLTKDKKYRKMKIKQFKLRQKQQIIQQQEHDDDEDNIKEEEEEEGEEGEKKKEPQVERASRNNNNVSVSSWAEERKGFEEIFEQHEIKFRYIGETRQEMYFRLSRERQEKFPEFLQELEENLKEKKLGMVEYGLSAATLEQVFLQLNEKKKDASPDGRERGGRRRAGRPIVDDDDDMFDDTGIFVMEDEMLFFGAADGSEEEEEGEGDGEFGRNDDEESSEFDLLLD